MAAIFFIFASMIVISSTASALTFSNSKTTSSSGKSTKNKEIKIYDVEFTEKVSKELLGRIVAKTDFDFSQYSLRGDISKKMQFQYASSRVRESGRWRGGTELGYYGR